MAQERDRRERIARNEATYRDVNEAIEAGRRNGDDDPQAPRPFMCECGLLECNELLELTLAEYEGVRAHPDHFFMVEGHDIPDVESVIERHERYVVAEKKGETKKIVRETDPRRR